MALSDEILRQRLTKQKWTAHNVRLSTEVTTIPGTPDFLETDMRLHAVLRMLTVIYRDNFANLRAADLGCLEGGFTLALAQRGAEILGIEARERNIEKCLLLKEHFQLPNLEFIRDDVKNFTRDKYGIFDVVLALGILYHLDQPVTWLHQIAAASRAVLVLDTHYAPANDDDLRLLDPTIAKLGPLEELRVSESVYRGRWFTEYTLDAQRDDLPWASYSNMRSFWLTKESILLTILHLGFDIVLEQHDLWTGRLHQYYTTTYPRIMLIGIKRDGLESYACTTVERRCRIHE